jgi:hypothetical protein
MHLCTYAPKHLYTYAPKHLCTYAPMHPGNSLDADVEGAAAAGWTPIRFNEWFDEDFPDWYAIETNEEADAGADSR